LVGQVLEYMEIGLTQSVPESLEIVLESLEHLTTWQMTVSFKTTTQPNTSIEDYQLLTSSKKYQVNTHVKVKAWPCWIVLLLF
jgi:hypothetical protein